MKPEANVRQVSPVSDRVGSVDPQDVFRPHIIGIYGVSGCGKTHLMSRLINQMHGRFNFFEGSEVIAEQVDGGLDAFKSLSPQDKREAREKAIRSVYDQCKATRRFGLVAGHLTLWDQGHCSISEIYTSADLDVYTHIIYLDVEPELVAKRTSNDCTSGRKKRGNLSVDQIGKWQAKEKTILRELCREHKIILAVIKGEDQALQLVRRFHRSTEQSNHVIQRRELDKFVERNAANADTVFVFDADKTLAEADSGALFWQHVPQDPSGAQLREIFKNCGYTWYAFFQANLLYYENFSEMEFNGLCDAAAASISISPEVRKMLHEIAQNARLSVLVVTCGLERVWSKVIANANMSDDVYLLGNKFLADDEYAMIVTPELKRVVVEHLQYEHIKNVVAVGDSPIDLPMMRQADNAIVMVGPEETRSKSMEEELSKAIIQGLRPKQLLIPPTGSPRLNIDTLPLITIADVKFSPSCSGKLDLTHFTHERATSLLTSATRDADMTAPRLREAHGKVGAYLAIRYLSEAIGLEKFPMRHCTGGMTEGHRLDREEETLIVPLMRAGEPMALGVSEVFPAANMLHAKKATDITVRHIAHRARVILVDAVINSGGTIIEFVKHIRKLNPDIPIYVLAGVVQSDCIRKNGPLDRLTARFGNLSICALRLSENKYKGIGTTDTGHRLFNTAYLDAKAEK